MQTIYKLMNLKGRRALITGATGGLGRVIAKTLAELGADLLLVDRPGSDFSVLINQLTQFQVKSTELVFDLENEKERQILLDVVKQDSQELSILVNSAAFVGASNLEGWAVPFEQQTLETWRRALEVNITAIFHLSQGLAPVLLSSPGAVIINIASIYGMLGPDWKLYEATNMSNPAAYAASKGGLIQLTRWLSTTLAPTIRVNCISPGGIWCNQPQSFVQRYESRTPLKRMANNEDFAGVIAFLASDQARYVTGQNIAVDGGWSVW